MKKTNIIYWIFTALFLGFMLFSAIPEIRQNADSKAFMDHLGYPGYINPFLGVLKVLGMIAILVPGYPRLKEWAYVGFFFDLLGATYSLISSDGFKPEISFMALPFVLWLVSYIYFHKRLGIAGKTAGKAVVA
jgi:hypothetical protein